MSVLLLLLLTVHIQPPPFKYISFNRGKSRFFFCILMGKFCFFFFFPPFFPFFFFPPPPPPPNPLADVLVTVLQESVAVCNPEEFVSVSEQRPVIYGLVLRWCRTRETYRFITGKNITKGLFCSICLASLSRCSICRL